MRKKLQSVSRNIKMYKVLAAASYNIYTSCHSVASYQDTINASVKKIQDLQFSHVDRHPKQQSTYFETALDMT
uniref:Uncharacterized protein n=1 Tax=Arion vulgaris TaxID=1028688 RepID=A0A0B7AUG0_9EUPU